FGSLVPFMCHAIRPADGMDFWFFGAQTQTVIGCCPEVFHHAMWAHRSHLLHAQNLSSWRDERRDLPFVGCTSPPMATTESDLGSAGEATRADDVWNVKRVCRKGTRHGLETVTV